MSRPCVFAFVIAAVFVRVSSAQQIDWDALEQYAEQGRQTFEIPGMAMAVVRGEEVLWARGFGVREVRGQDAVTPDTSFAVASNSKAFTASLVGALVDEGRLGWDDRVIDTLPQLQMYDDYVTRDLRLRDLMCHRAGLPLFGGDCLWIGNDLSADEILVRLRHLEPSAPFRTRYQYNNLMWMLAGMVVEKVRGQSWQEEVRERLIEPLGMGRTSTSMHDLPGIPNVATPHERRAGVVEPVAYDDVDAIAPAGALHSTVLDMARWMALHLGGGEYAGRRLLSKAVVREMQTVQIAIPVSAEVEKKLGRFFSGYGLGWGLSDYRGHKTVGHGGGLSGMISRQLMVPELGLGVVIVTNFADHPLCNALAYRVIDDWLGEPERDWVAEARDRAARSERNKQEAEEKLQSSRVQGTSPGSPPSAYCGTYHNPMIGDAELRLEDGHLVFDYNPRHLGDLEHWHHETWRVTWRDPIFDMDPRVFLTFRRDDSGAIVGLGTRFYHSQEFARR